MASRKETDTDLRRIWGMVLLTLCVFVTLGLFSYDWKDISYLHSPPNSPPDNLIGPVGAWVSYALFSGFGVGAYLVPLWCLAFGLYLILSRERRVWLRGVWSGLAVLCAAALVQLGPAFWLPVSARLNINDPGGVVGQVLMNNLLVRWLSPFGAGLFAASVFVLAIVLLFEADNLIRVGQWVFAAGAGLARKAGGSLANPRTAAADPPERREYDISIAEAPKDGAEPEPEPEPEEVVVPKPARRTRRFPVDETPPPEPAPPESETPPPPEPEPLPPPEPEPTRLPVREPARKPKESAPPEAASEPATVDLGATSASPYQLPPIDLLHAPAGGTAVAIDTSTTSQILVETLEDFGIQAEVVNVERGPVVTSYELLPAPGIKVEKISALSNNLALALKATSVRVQAPIPGKGVVGIEVPNSVAKMVYLREIVESDKWRSPKLKIPLALGADVSGNDLIADLADMPHLLIAGSTGSGKTVCMNSILAGLLMSRTPEQLRLLLVDPKIVEFSAYNHLPHLVVPVITDPKKVVMGLRWAINEMEKRYKLFARVGVRNIESYNTRQVARQEFLFGEPPEAREDEPPARLPYIVIIVDELADLMLAAQADIENSVARLAQLSRAVGIHMIISTQRPSVDVITGTIKANLPARIAFQVAQKTDSRTILDTIGAEKLLGRGDMLFLPPGTSKLVRAQGALTTDDEIHSIVAFIKKQAEPSYALEIKEKLDRPGDVTLDDEADEEMLNQAVAIIRETRRASTSSLQRRLRIGYTRAARIMDILEERGIIGPPRGSDPREILIDLDGEIPENAPDPDVPDSEV